MHCLLKRGRIPSHGQDGGSQLISVLGRRNQIRRAPSGAARALVTLGLLALACDAHSPYDPTRDPEKDLAAALKQAEASGKRVLVVVGGEWCSWCKILDKFVTDDPEVGALWEKHFVTVHVNVSPENENTAFMGRFPPINGYPHVFVLERDGRLLHSQGTGGLESGASYSREKMAEFLRAWRP